MKRKVFLNKEVEIDALRYAFIQNIFIDNIKKEYELVEEFLYYLKSKNILNEFFDLRYLVFKNDKVFKKELKKFLKKKDIKPINSIRFIYKELLNFYDDYEEDEDDEDEDEYDEDDDYEDEDEYDEDEDDNYKENESCFLDKDTQKFISDLYDFLRNYDFK